MPKLAGETLPLLHATATHDAASPWWHIPPRLLGVVLVMGSAFLYSVLSLLIKVASYEMPSMETVFWRSIVAWAINLVAMRVYAVDPSVPRQLWPPLAVRCLVGTCAMALSFYAIQQLALADASVLLFTSPIWTFFLGALVLSERIDAIHFALALVCFVGVICVARPTWLFDSTTHDDDDKGNGNRDGVATTASSAVAVAIACALLGAATRSVVYVSMRKLQQLHFMVVIHYYLLTTTIVSIGWLVVVQRTFVLDMSRTAWLAVVGSGGVGFFSQLLLTRGFQLETAGVASVMRNLDVVFAFLWDLTLLHEPVSGWSVLGAVLISGCVVLIARRRMKTQ